VVAAIPALEARSCRHPVPGAEAVRQLLDTRFHSLLIARLGPRDELAIRHDLGGGG